ncbi:MAG: cytochrome bc complex cytochrome b subunit [Thermoplasmatales archaeon]
MTSILEKIRNSRKNMEKPSEWLLSRAGLANIPMRKTPDYMRKWGGKWYWTGALITVAFTYEVITGLILLLYYNPADPYTATQYILTSVPYGKLLLATHLYGAYAMIILVYVHLFRNYFAGAYKKPRELQWIIGVVLLALTLGVGYFGYSLTGDVLSYDAQDVGRGIAGLVPFIGNWLVSVGFGNGTATSLFSKFLGFHIIFAALIALLFGYHFYLAEANTMLPSSKVSHYKVPAVTPETEDMKPWYPSNLLYILELGLFTIGFIILIPSFVGLFPSVPILISPFPGPAPTSPLAALIPPYPPWFLLFAYKAVDFKMFSNAFGPLEAMIVFALIPLIYFLIVPFLDRGKSLHPLDRPLTTSIGILSIVYLVVFSLWGAFTPGIAIPTSQVILVMLPPAVITFGSIIGISRLWKSGKLRPGARTITSSFFIFIAGLIAAIILAGYTFSSLVSHFTPLVFGKFSLSLFSVAFLAIGTARTSNDLPDKKIGGSPVGAYAAMGIITLLCWVLLALTIRLNPISQAMLVGMILGTVFIFSGITMAIYRRLVYGE